MGNRTQVLEGGTSVVTWSYDETYRLKTEKRSGTGAFSTTYTYDDVGNRTVQQKGGALTSYTYDAANQLVTSVSATGMTTYTYDQAGNLTLVHAPGNVRTSYSWDDENRNTKLIIPGGAITTMAYRHDGLRVRKQTAAGTTKFIYDGQNYLLETDGSDTINRVLTSEPMGYGNLVSQRVKSGAVWTPYYHHYDALGSTRQMTGSAGSIVNSYAYTAWGEAIAALTSESIANFFRWVGMLGYFFDDEADTCYVRARHYDPGTGRWLSQDPLFYPVAARGAMGLEWNLLSYARENPVTGVDPRGELYTLGRPHPVITGPPGQELPPTIGLVQTPVVSPAQGVWVVGIMIGAYVLDRICRPRPKCKLVGSGGPNKKKKKKRCTYSCDGGPAEDAFIDIGPGNWDPPCPGWDGSEIEKFW